MRKGQQNYINNRHWDWSLGITKKNKIFIKDISISHVSKNKFFKVLKHEINHLYLNSLNANSSIPRWFNEGFAMHYANDLTIAHKLNIAKHLGEKSLFDIYQLDNKFYNNSKELFHFAYAYSNLIFNTH